MSFIVSSIVDVSMNKIASTAVPVDDWTAELAIIASDCKVN